MVQTPDNEQNRYGPVLSISHDGLMLHHYVELIYVYFFCLSVYTARYELRLDDRVSRSLVALPFLSVRVPSVRSSVGSPDRALSPFCLSLDLDLESLCYVVM